MELFLHLGAHRCGSTAVERTLTRNTQERAELGIEIWNPLSIRRRRYFADKMKQVPGQDPTKLAEEGRAKFHQDVKSCENSGIKKLVISEENLVGTIGENLKLTSLYPRVKENFSSVADMFEPYDLTVGLGIRDYCRHWSSCFAYYASRRPYSPRNNLTDAIMADDRGWTEIISDLADIFAKARLVVWDAPSSHKEIVDIWRIFLQDDMLVLPQKLHRNINPTPGAQALELARKLRAVAPDISMAEINSAILNIEKAGDTRFSLFDASQENELTSRYQRDLTGLAADRLVTLVCDGKFRRAV